MTIFNRWGGTVFTTSDPDIDWNGRQFNTGEECPEGVYFYVCKVNEIQLNPAENPEPKVLKGFIHLIRGEKLK
jgi:hypothetical protein